MMLRPLLPFLLSGCAAAPFRLSQYNATLILAEEPFSASIGQYASGDYWVVGPITIIGTEPAAAAGRNGFEISPKSIHAQPYDARAAGYDAALLPSLPAVVSAGNNVVKMVSLASWPGGNPTFVSDAIIVTVVAAPPPAGAFRPPYFRNNSAVAAREWTTAQLRWDLYPSLELPPAPQCPPAPAILCTPPPALDDAVTQRYSMPQIDHMNDWSGGQIHPSVKLVMCASCTPREPATLTRTSFTHTHRTQKQHARLPLRRGHPAGRGPRGRAPPTKRYQRDYQGGGRCWSRSIRH
jgi:hypothetical protein